jgi:hypothetical protein
MELTNGVVGCDSTGTSASMPLTVGMVYNYRWEFGNVELKGESGGTLAFAVNRIRVWKWGTTQPTSWTLDAQKSNVWLSGAASPFIEGFWIP